MPAALRIAAITAAQENASARYDFARGPAAAADRLTGHNHAQRLGIDVDVRGAHVSEMGAGNAGVGWRLSLGLGQICRESACSTIEAGTATLDASGNRAVIHHVGGVAEWYVNGPLGVEQGFTIAHRPTVAGEADGAPLVLDVDLSGDLSPTMQADGGWVSLVDESGRAVARYSDLYARDAGGRLLDARMVASDERISLVVSDEGASYPIEIDPLVWVEVVKLASPNPENYAHFAFSVAVDGETALVGVPDQDSGGTSRGTAFIFERNYPNVDAWGLRATLVKGGTVWNGDRFGAAVALSGDTAIVGAPSDNGAGTDRGAAFVYERNVPGPNGWGLSKRIEALDAQDSDNFGQAVAIYGSTAVVGAPGQDAGGSYAGAAYVFDRSYGGSENWGQRVKLLAGDAQSNDGFGKAVAAFGDTAIVGADGEDGAGTNRGSAYVFDRNYLGANAWGQRKKLVALDTQDNDNFGYAVTIGADTAVIGAPEEDGAGVDRGAAYVFERNDPTADSWGQVAKLTASDPEDSAVFGGAVSIHEDMLLVAAVLSDRANTDAGALYWYERDQPTPGAWGERGTLTMTDAAALDRLGTGLVASGEFAIVGAGYAAAGGTEQGVAYVLAVLLSDGDACSTGSECVSGFCADDVCCNTECAGGLDDCRACSVGQGAAADGVCGPIEDGSTCDDGQYCTTTDTCSGGTCGGSGDPCAELVGDADSDCSESCDEEADDCIAEDPGGSACDDGVYCNGNETCVAGVCGSSTGDPCTGPDSDDDCSESCDEGAAACTGNDPDGSSCAGGVQTCGAGVCLGAPGSDCTDDAECESSFCTDSVCCTLDDCTPYRCGAAGDCGSTCTMSGECATGFHCDGTGRCVADAAPGGSTEDEGGCSCRLGSERRERDGLVSLLGLAAVLGLRRRRRA